ncbi:MAG TPA: MOSC domain-containing protein [Hyphomicrobiaceae bacterium]|jgi:MOSC domain-containing protein YiiM
MSQVGSIVGVFAGGVATFVAQDGRPLTTGIRKFPTADGFLEAHGLRGDASAEADHHTAGKAVHLFADENYEMIEQRLGIALPRPTFGENLTATGIREEDVCVGDHYQVGEAVICVTQPTERCKTVGRSNGIPKILKVLHELDVCGFYARILRPGRVAAGDPVVLRKRFQPGWSINRLHRLMFHGLADEELVTQAMAIEQLSTEWKKRTEVMRGRLRRGEPLSSNLVDL